MRIIVQGLLLNTLMLLAAIGSFSVGKGCNLTSLTMTSSAPSGPNWVVTAQLCVGAGVTGFVQGADQLTSSMAIFLYGPGGAPLTVLSSTPASITSTFRGCTMNNTPDGPMAGCYSPDPCGPPYFNDVQDIVWFTNGFCDFLPPCPPPCDMGFTCILTTPLCGNVHQDCFSMTFTTDVRPDSLRLLGAEGAGQAFAGCYPNPDMLVCPPCVLPVVWGAVQGENIHGANQIRWSTRAEKNNKHFEVLRALPNGNFEVIGIVPGKGDSGAEQFYTFTDNRPQGSSNIYKLLQRDLNGASQESDAVTVSNLAAGFAWLEIGPNPVKDKLNAEFLTMQGGEITWSILDLGGKAIRQQTMQSVTGANSMLLDLADLKAGLYFIELNGPEGRLVKKILKY